MMHPSHLTQRELDLAYLGDPSSRGEEHAEYCPTCRQALHELETRRAALLRREPAETYVRRLRAEQARLQGRATNNRRVWGALAVAAAATLYLVRGSVLSSSDEEQKLALLETMPSAGPIDPQASQSVQLLPKGESNLSIIRRRHDEEAILQGRVTVVPGDEIRLRFLVEKAGPVSAGVLTDGGDWILLFETDLPTGTHTPLTTLRVTEEPGAGRVLVGTPESVAAARAGKPSDAQQAELVWLARSDSKD